MNAPANRDFFISYTSQNQSWAEWVAWELEEAGYTTVLQAWDFTPGGGFVSAMHEATQNTERTIALLSAAYAESAMASAEWQEAWRRDRSGDSGALLVFRVEDCDRPGLLAQIVSIDLFGVDKTIARSRLLRAVKRGRAKPDLPPGFPGVDAPIAEPTFPGRLVPSDFSSAMAAGGPPSFDNPYAVAFAWWSAVIDLDESALERVVTPESIGMWDVQQLADRTELNGLTTGVHKPVFDVAYVKLMDNAPQGDGPHRVVGGWLPMDAMVISLVFRPELGGWRVHAVGLPQDPDSLPRTWRP